MKEYRKWITSYIYRGNQALVEPQKLILICRNIKKLFLREGKVIQAI